MNTWHANMRAAHTCALNVVLPLGTLAGSLEQPSKLPRLVTVGETGLERLL